MKRSQEVHDKLSDELLCSEHMALSVHKAGQAMAMIIRGESGWQGAVKRAHYEMLAAWDLAEAISANEEDKLRESDA